MSCRMGYGACSMVNALLMVASTLLAAPTRAQSINYGYRSSKGWLPRHSKLTAPTGEELVAVAKLPKHWDWRNVGGKNLVASDINQHLPQYCGSCWIHGAVGALNDRLKIMRNGAYPDIMFSRQVIMNCVPGENASLPPPGCDGGDAFQIHAYLHSNRVPDETCMPYTAKNEECTAYDTCRNCAPTIIALPGVPMGCFPIRGWYGYGIGDYGQVSGEVAMMKEIYARGPIACNMGVDAEFVEGYIGNVVKHEGVYVTDKFFNDTDHVVSVTGWGETASGRKYWLVRNSWGTYWGDLGWFKLRRGVNQMQIESECDWAVPTYDDLSEGLQGKIFGDYGIGAQHVSQIQNGPQAAGAATPEVPPQGVSATSEVVRTAQDPKSSHSLGGAACAVVGAVLATTAFAALGRAAAQQSRPCMDNEALG
mmetsp:Transcript_30086/g.58107  ORF Transcript_30086/g.58107 Transcript_30086/m.58107 type:complete len:422 (-) Transcript_30086:242-1507(-)